MEQQIFESYSREDTLRIGEQIGQRAKAGDIYALHGDLGVGKTVLTKGLAKGLGIEEPVNSPTFTILQIYTTGRLPLYHFDVYRIEDPEEMEEVGFDDYIFGQGVSIIEWPEKIEEILPEGVTHVTIEKDLAKGLDYRRIVIGPAAAGSWEKETR